MDRSYFGGWVDIVVEVYGWVWGGLDFGMFVIRRIGEVLYSWFFRVFRNRGGFIVEGEIRKREEVNKWFGVCCYEIVGVFEDDLGVVGKGEGYGEEVVGIVGKGRGW